MASFASSFSCRLHVAGETQPHSVLTQKDVKTVALEYTRFKIALFLSLKIRHPPEDRVLIIVNDYTVNLTDSTESKVACK